MWAGEYISFSIRVTTVVVPVALYFFILGLLNSRRHPQVLSGRLDFALLIGALSPLFVVPVLHYVGVSAVSVALAVGGVACAILLLAPRNQAWVIYNAAESQVREAVESVLADMGIRWRSGNGLFRVDDSETSIQLTSFPMLRNVSVRFNGPDEAGRRFARRLGGMMGGTPVETPRSAVALLLVATGMLVTPLLLMANQAGEIVRILTDLLN